MIFAVPCHTRSGKSHLFALLGKPAVAPGGSEMRFNFEQAARQKVYPPA